MKRLRIELGSELLISSSEIWTVSLLKCIPKDKSSNHSIIAYSSNHVGFRRILTGKHCGDFHIKKAAPDAALVKRGVA
jgi:hypothetical protein